MFFGLDKSSHRLSHAMPMASEEHNRIGETLLVSR